MANMDIYNRLAVTPAEARKPIEAGRLKGMTDINPMWRIKALTETFGAYGVGWYLEDIQTWTQDGAGDEVKAFARVSLVYKTIDGWSKPAIGYGGASFIAKESKGMYTDDECYKKAVTDAIGSACKLLGMSADIYFAHDRTKYTAYKPESPAVKCECCGKVIGDGKRKDGSVWSAEDIAAYTARKFGKTLCYDCASKEGK